MEDKNVIKIIQRSSKGLQDYIVIYYTIEKGENIPLVTYDLTHGFPHRTLDTLMRGTRGGKKRFPTAPMKELLEEAMVDIYENWRRFLQEYKSELK